MRRGHEIGFPVVQIGVRSYSREEYEYFSAHNITVFEWGRGTMPTVDDLIRSIKTERVYLTLDVDGIDPANMPATGTPVQGGLEWRYAETLVRSLARQKTIVGADVVEVAPREGDLLTQMGAARLIYALIGESLLKSHGNEHSLLNDVWMLVPTTVFPPSSRGDILGRVSQRGLAAAIFRLLCG